MVAGWDVSNYQISVNNTRVVYRADQDANNVFELYNVPITGGGATRVNHPLPFSSDVDSFDISPNGRYILYSADQDVFDELELFAVEYFDEAVCFPIKIKVGVAVICL